VTADKLASAVTRETLDRFRAELRRVGHVPEQVARHVQVVKQVYEWAVDRDLIPPTKVATYKYKRGRDEKAMVIPEYTPKEARALLGGLDPRDSRQWRLYVALHVFAFAGPRQFAARHLEWRDIDFSAGTVRWRPELDKLGYDRTQLLPSQVLDALWVAYGWRCALGYDGPFVLFRPSQTLIDQKGSNHRHPLATKRRRERAAATIDKPWTYQAFNQALARLEHDVNVKHIPYRSAHGFRRYVVTEVLARTGNLVLAGQYVGDKDVRTLMRSYVRERPEEMRGVVGHMEQTAEVHADGATRNADATRDRQSGPEWELPRE
jgi:integrase